MSHRLKVLAAASVLTALAAPAAHAALGDALVATGGNIVIRFEGSDASFSSLISVNGGPQVFPNKTTAVGALFDLGDFAAGTALDISLSVSNGNVFHTGPGAGNPDGQPHANVIYDFDEPGRTYVGFEDIFGGGDRDYNDHQFSFTNIAPVAAIPEPETYALMLGGLAFTGLLVRRRRTAAR